MAYPVWKANGAPSELHWQKELLQMVLVFPIVTDAWFYVFHKLGHHKKLYKHIHKIHHTYEAPEAITGTSFTANLKSTCATR